LVIFHKDSRKHYVAYLVIFCGAFLDILDEPNDRAN